MLIDASWRILRRLPPKFAYKIVHSIPHQLVKMISSGTRRDEEPLVEFLGVKLSNPVGLAAGLDKDGDLAWLSYRLGFGFTVVGSVLPVRHRGVDEKILERLSGGSLVNRLGLPSKGAEYVVERLKDKPPIPVAVNIAALEPSGYSTVYSMVEEYADWIEVNVSCPNTVEHGTFEKPEWVERILSSLPPGGKPVLVKLPPVEEADLVREYAEVVASSRAAGAVVSNTLKVKVDGGVQAGLSGEKLYPVMMGMLRRMREYLPDDKVLVAVGGITTPERALKALEYADLIEVLTALLYYGPGRVREIIEETVKFIGRRS